MRAKGGADEVAGKTLAVGDDELCASRTPRAPLPSGGVATVGFPTPNPGGARGCSSPRGLSARCWYGGRGAGTSRSRGSRAEEAGAAGASRLYVRASESRRWRKGVEEREGYEYEDWGAAHWWAPSMSTTMSFAWVSEMTVSLSLSEALVREAEASWMGGTVACETEIVLCIGTWLSARVSVGG